ncbi:MAG: hypothetical protein ACOVKO_06945 [Elstera sp.]
MSTSFADSLVGVFVAVLGILGLFMASGAVDAELYLFGLSLFALGVLFNFSLVKSAFDRQDAARSGESAQG